MGVILIGTFPRRTERVIVRQPRPKGPSEAAKAVWGGGRAFDAR